MFCMKQSKDMTNLEIAELLRAVAASYELKNADKNKFKIIAYDRAADAVEHASSELKDLWDDGKLTDVPGVGKSIAEHLDELFRTGKSRHFEIVMKGLPPSMFSLMEVPGIGAKTAYKLVRELKLENVPAGSLLAKLGKLAKQGKIAEIEGFGQESQTKILKSIEQTRSKVKRHLLPYATEIAEEVIAWLKKERAIQKVDTLGSLRRQASTIGDIDISVATDKGSAVIAHFCAYPKKTRVLEKGEKTASVILPSDVQVDLMVQPPDSYGSLLQHFTGSKHHNIALRDYALKKGFSLSEYGIRELKNKRTKEIKKFKTEEEFYKFLGMEWIPPELREDTGELEAAKAGKLPKLVGLNEIRADLQIHSDFDIETSHDLGESSMEEIVKKANELGYEYLAFTEHNPSKSRHNEKQIIGILRRKKDIVDKLNYSLLRRDGLPAGKAGKRVKRVFNSLEIDIMPDGSLPVPDPGLETLDFALVSIHSSFQLNRGSMTRRVLSALSHPKVKIFAHPTARKLNEREGVELNWPEIFEFCLKNGKWLEINADPMRLDLPDYLVHEAVKAGVKLTLGTDAHSVGCLEFMRWGVSVARRGWCEKSDIINTRTLSEFEKLLK
jgi:DNA polymerase (family 10)